MFNSVILLVMSAVPTADASSAKPKLAEYDKARELVKLLGDNKYRIRAAAEKQLVSLGMASLAALKEGENSSDVHVADRCRSLQPTIRSLTLQKRIENFLTNTKDPEITKSLPLAESFLKITGDSKEARELYSHAYQASPELFESVLNNPAKAQVEFTSFCQDANTKMMRQQGIDFRIAQRMITLTDVITYFIVTHELAERKISVNNGHGYVFMNSVNLPENLGRSDATGAAVKKLFLAYIDKEKQVYMIQRALQIAAEAKMNETLPLVLKLVKDKDTPNYTRAQVALMLLKLGSKDNLKDVAPLLEDKTVVGNFGINNVQGQVQIRDVALAVSIKLSGQKMSDYPFDVMKGNDDIIHLSYIYCAFTGEKSRNAAFEKFKDSQKPKSK